MQLPSGHGLLPQTNQLKQTRQAFCPQESGKLEELGASQEKIGYM